MHYIFFILVFNLGASSKSSLNLVDKFQKQRLELKRSLALMKEAYELLQKVSDSLVDSSDFFRALEFFKLKEYDKCIPIFSALIKKKDHPMESTFFLAESLLAKKEYMKAASIYGMVINEYNSVLDENSIQILKTSFLQLSNCFLALHQVSDAIAVIKRYIIRFPEEKKSREIYFFCKKYNCSEILNNKSDQNEDEMHTVNMLN